MVFFERMTVYSACFVSGPGAIQPCGAGAHVNAAIFWVSVRSFHLADGDEVVPKRFERLHDRLEFEVAADLVRMPQLRINAVRHIDCAEAKRPRFGLSR